MLDQATASPDYINYITYIFSHPQSPPLSGIHANEYPTVRFAAGTYVKTKIAISYGRISPESLVYVKAAALHTLHDTNRNVSRAAGNIITTLVKEGAKKGGLLQWPEIINDLLCLVGNTAGNVPMPAREASMDALLMVCDDNRRILEREYSGQCALNTIIPSLLGFTSIESPKIRAASLSAIHVFLPQRPRVLMAALDQFLSQLFALASESNTEVRKMVCVSFSQLVDIAPEKLAPHMEGLVNYIIMQQQCQDDPELALEAAEFWITGADDNRHWLQNELAPYMPQIIPVLLQNMIYDEDEVARLMDEQDDADLEDRAEDLRPQFAKSKADRLNTSRPADQMNTAEEQQAEDESDLSEGEIEDSELGDDPSDEWTLRKCSAAALDIFANVHQSPVFEIILPYLKETLRHEQWPNREAAVLTLGAVADGCMEAVIKHLPELVPYLISLLADPQPAVRQITCWCLSRYSKWAAELGQAQKAEFFEPMMDGILCRMLDNNKKVQEAAASAFASLEEKSEENLKPYCEPILRQFVECFGKYKDRNMYILYDCVQTLADSVGEELAPQLEEILMPTIIERYNFISDDSRDLFPLLECLGFLADAYGPAFAKYAPEFFARCKKIIYNNLEASVQFANKEIVDEPDKDFLITSIDLISCIIQAIDPQDSCKLIEDKQTPFFGLLCYCLQYYHFEVRQSTYALLGDCAIKVYSDLRPFLPQILPILIKQLDLDSIPDDDRHVGFSVLNNACWSCGEIAVKVTGDETPHIEPYVNGLYKGMFRIIESEEIPESVTENGAMALGRLGSCCAKQMAPHLGEFSQKFLELMDRVELTDEKASALLGFNQIVMKNPQAMEASLLHYFSTIASFGDSLVSEYRDLQVSCRQVRVFTISSHSLADLLCQVIQGYQNIIPNFSNVLNQLPPSTAHTLRAVCQI